jgi:hypothetical protein
MQSLLNLIWLVFGTAAFGVWFATPRRALRPISSPRIAILLVCCLVLLFPIISANDDAQMQREFMDNAALASAADGKVKHHVPVLDLLATATPQITWRFQAPDDPILRCALSFSAPSTDPGFAIRVTGRAPPIQLG